MSKKYDAAKAKVDADKLYTVEEAIKLAKEIATEKFDTTLNLSLNLNLDTAHADQQLRGSLVLPNGTGKTAKVLVVGDSEIHKEASEAGADHVGGIEMLEKVKAQNWFDFDYIVTTPSFMPQLAKYGKLLGPKGLMPNPKLGTVTNNIAKVVNDIKLGQIEYRTDKDGIISIGFGKKSFDDAKLIENYELIYSTVKGLRPAAVKGTYIKSVCISTTMGPGIMVKGE